MSVEEPKPSKCFFDMWQQDDIFTPPTDQSAAFYVELRLNFVVDYTPVSFSMNVRSEKRGKLLRRSDLLDDSKNRGTMSTMLKFLPVPESAMEGIIKIVSSKAKSIENDSRNTRREVIPVVMSLRVFYSQEYSLELEVSWALRLGSNVSSIKSGGGIPAMETAVKDLNTVTFYKGCSLGEQCAVCLVGFRKGSKITRMPCSHDYHKRCIGKWLKQSHVCPVCRFPLPVCLDTEELCPFKLKTPEIRPPVFRKPRMRVRRQRARRNLVYGGRTFTDLV